MTGDFGKMVELKGGGVRRGWYFDGEKKQTEQSHPLLGLINVLLPNTREEISHECSL